MASNKTQKQLRDKARWGIVGIFALFFIASGYVMPGLFNKGLDGLQRILPLGIPHVSETPFQLGLDLQGGAHLVYQANVDGIIPAERGAAVEGVRDVIERRVNGVGVGEPHVQTTKVGEEYRVIVELPGITDVNAAISMIGETPILEFREQNTEPARLLTVEEQEAIDIFNQEARQKADDALKRIRAGEAFDVIAQEVSEDTESKNNGGYIGFVDEQRLSKEVLDFLSTGIDNVTSDIIDGDSLLSIVKRAGEQEGKGAVTASHILVCYVGAERCPNTAPNEEEALALARDVYDQATAENFGSLAELYSEDSISKQQAGLIGTFPRGIFGEEFDTAVFGAEAGSIIGPVKSPIGYHVVYKQEHIDTKEYELSQISFLKQRAEDILPPQDPWMLTALSGKQLERAEVVSDPTTGAVQVSLQFDSEGADLFADITARNVGQPVAIYLDGEAISIPTVQQPITNGQAVITGSFSITEARLLTQRLNAGALPVPVDLISQQSVGASLGADSFTRSVKAGLFGILLVMLFMVLWYRIPGVVAVVSLGLYAMITLAIFKIIGVTLTLAGIAGIVLSIGMAVDANVLIFERLKEELRSGKSLKSAVEDGFVRAWSSIRDGNTSTLITCSLLIWFGSSFVQGFAVTLSIGILASMFTAITITRVILRFIVAWFPREGSALFVGYKK